MVVGGGISLFVGFLVVVLEFGLVFWLISLLFQHDAIN